MIKRFVICFGFICLMLFILFFLISCATYPPCPPCPMCPTCPPCPQKDVVFPVITPIGPLIVQLDKDFFSEINKGKTWDTLEDFIKEKEKIKKIPRKQILKEVNPDGLSKEFEQEFIVEWQAL